MNDNEFSGPVEALEVIEEAAPAEIAPAEDSPEEQAEPEKSFRDNLKEWVKDTVFAVAVAVIILQFIKPTIVQEHSMENTLWANDYLFISKQSYTLFGEPKRGDIIVFRSRLTMSDGSEKLLVKRIIGIPGDTVSITGGVVYINGVPQDEPYTKDGYTNTELPDTYVPEGQLFCMGDNRQNSRDSRDPIVGMVFYEDVLGKAVFRLFPFSRFGGLYD